MNMNKKPSIVFFGTPEFAVESLREIVKEGYEVKAVVTSVDKPAGRGMQLKESDVKKAAVELDIPVLQPEKLKAPEFIEKLQEINADLFIIIAFRMLPKEVWAMPRMGTFNLHASLLPEYRGAAPINWAVINGDTETGVTTFFLQHQIDTGDILLQEKISIGPEENVGSVYDRLMKLGARLTIRTLQGIADNSIVPVPQAHIPEDSLRPAPKLTKETSHIKWDSTSSEVINLIRGMSPYPGAWTELRSEISSPKIVKIYKAVKTGISSDNNPVGTVEIMNGRMFADTKNEKIEILEIQQQGKKKMSVSEYLLGAKLKNACFV